MSEIIPKKVGAILLLVVIVFSVLSTLSILNVMMTAQEHQQPVSKPVSGQISLTIEKQETNKEESTGELSLEVLGGQ